MITRLKSLRSGDVVMRVVRRDSHKWFMTSYRNTDIGFTDFTPGAWVEFPLLVLGLNRFAAVVLAVDGRLYNFYVSEKGTVDIFRMEDVKK